MFFALVVVPLVLIAIIAAIFMREETEEERKRREEANKSKKDEDKDDGSGRNLLVLIGLALVAAIVVAYVLPIILGFTFYGRQYNMTHLLFINGEDTYTKFNAVVFSMLRTTSMLFFLGNIIVGKPGRFLSRAQDWDDDGSKIFQVIGLVNDLTLKR